MAQPAGGEPVAFKVEEGPATEIGILCGPEVVQRVPAARAWNPRLKAVESGPMIHMICDMANRYLAEADAGQPHPSHGARVNRPNLSPLGWGLLRAA
jgi:hypothetical protein